MAKELKNGFVMSKDPKRNVAEIVIRSESSKK
jgi:hypothetical protein